jgi:hypothetical protein
MVVALRKGLAIRRMPPGAVGISSGASMDGAEEDVAPANPGLQMVAEEPSQEDAPVEEVLLSATLVEEGSGTGAPHSLPEVEEQAAPPPHQVDASSVWRTNEEMVREEPLPREIMVVAQEEAWAVGGEAAGAVPAGLVL